MFRFPGSGGEGRTVQIPLTGGSLGTLIVIGLILWFRRRAALGGGNPRPRRGYRKLFFDHVLQADEGCDFDFLRHPDVAPPAAPRRNP